MLLRGCKKVFSYCCGIFVLVYPFLCFAQKGSGHPAHESVLYQEIIHPDINLKYLIPQDWTYALFSEDEYHKAVINLSPDKNTSLFLFYYPESHLTPQQLVEYTAEHLNFSVDANRVTHIDTGQFEACRAKAIWKNKGKERYVFLKAIRHYDDTYLILLYHFGNKKSDFNKVTLNEIFNSFSLLASE